MDGEVEKMWIFPAERRRVLEDFYDLMILCNKCGYCKFIYAPEAKDARFVTQCPRGNVFKHLAYYASGTMEVARGIVEKRLKWSKTIEHVLYTCTDCYHCEFWCNVAMRVYPLTIMEIMKETYIKEVCLPDHYKCVLDNLEKNRNPYGEPHEKRFSWLSNPLPPKKAELMLFIGDEAAYKNRSIALAAVNILRRLKVDFGLLYEDEWHSGYLLFRGGLREKGMEMVKHNFEALVRAGAKRVVVVSPHDYRTFKVDAENSGLHPDFEVQHILEFLHPLIEENKNEFKMLNRKVTYHDPCQLVRHVMPFKISEQPREILKALGMEVVEMPRNRLNAYCCGAGGGVPFGYPNVTKLVARARLAEAATTGAKEVVVSCPSCEMSLGAVCGEFGLSVKHILTLIQEALGGQ
ncbi:MAG: (Fe-S)-binding protein [Candidatus Nezhaarchaeales archaeon]